MNTAIHRRNASGESWLKAGSGGNRIEQFNLPGDTLRL